MKIKFLTFKTALLVASITIMACGGNQGNENQSTQVSEENTEMAESESVSINLDASTVMWKGTMIGMYYHEGTIELADASLEVSGDKITGGSFTVDMTSMNPTDENYNAEEDRTPEKLVGHLSAPDFFDVANHPIATYEITGSSDNKVAGNMTIRGITHEETVENVSYNGANKTWNGTLTFDRKKYDVSFDMTIPDMVLSDDIELSINLSL